LKKDANFFKELGKLRSEGIDEGQTALIKEHFSKGDKRIAIYKTIPFAVWILIGGALSVIFKGSVLQLFYALIR
jgi:prepilin signal peptidase PulO-like enzyme (type II secretory pathway)